MDNLDCVNDSGEEITPETKTKYPFRIVETKTREVIDAIPSHLKQLEAQTGLIKEYQARREWILLEKEQTEASNVVKHLKSDLYVLRDISHCVKDEDVPKFQKIIEEPTNNVISAIATFLEENSNALRPVPKLDFEVPSKPEIPALICERDKPAADRKLLFGSSQAQLDENLLEEPLRVQTQWEKLATEIYELNEVFKKLSRFVFSQKESVDRIEDNVQNAHENIVEGTKHLGKAAVLQAATFPVAGAAIGGMILGPVGAIAGFKLFGTIACAVSGSVLGLGAGLKLKKRRHASCEMEMKALTYPTKSHPLSTPHLTKSLNE